MTAPEWLSPSQRAAYDRGAERARTDCADVADPTTMSVTLDRGGGLDGRIHIAWCLIHQTPTDRCACGAPEVVEDADEVEVETVAELIARTREQLDIYATAVTPIADVVAGDRL